MYTTTSMMLTSLTIVKVQYHKEYDTNNKYGNCSGVYHKEYDTDKKYDLFRRELQEYVTDNKYDYYSGVYHKEFDTDNKPHVLKKAIERVEEEGWIERVSFMSVF